MTWRPIGSQNPMLSRLLTSALLLSLGSFSGGCLAAIPLAVSAAKAVGSSVLNAAAEHQAAKGEKKEDFVDEKERCDNLEQDQPAVIELRTAREGQPPEWRELSLNSATGDPVWAPAMDMGNPSTWRPAQNLGNMKFTPPLAMPEKPGKSEYVVYAAAEPKDALEQDQLTGLSTGFASKTGTFQWHDRPYEYATVEKLPCFPIAQAMK